jgi:hypothetical protein
MKKSDYDEANQKIIDDLHKWRFKPYMDQGHAVPVCTVDVFMYKLDGK